MFKLALKSTHKPVLACDDALQKFSDLGITLDNVRRASQIAMEAGGDFIKTSTGKVNPAVTLPVTLVMLEETLGDDWLTPDLFRFGASTLVNDVLMQIARLADGNYQSGEYFSLS